MSILQGATRPQQVRRKRLRIHPESGMPVRYRAPDARRTTSKALDWHPHVALRIDWREELQA